MERRQIPKKKGVVILNITDNEKKSPLSIIPVNFTDKSLGKLRKAVLRLNAEFDKSKKLTTKIGDVYE